MTFENLTILVQNCVSSITSWQLRPFGLRSHDSYLEIIIKRPLLTLLFTQCLYALYLEIPTTVSLFFLTVKNLQFVVLLVLMFVCSVYFIRSYFCKLISDITRVIVLLYCFNFLSHTTFVSIYVLIECIGLSRGSNR